MSTQKQGEGASLDAQKDAITDFASQNDLTVTEWFEEKETAAKSGRPIFNQMMTRLRKGQATGLIMHKIDRSARNMRDWNLVVELPKFGVKPYFVVDNDLCPKFPPAWRGALGVKSLALGSHLVHCLSLQEFHGRQVAQS